jgi:hypothetical protein
MSDRVHLMATTLEVCKQHGPKPEELVMVADEIEVNVAFVDDLAGRYLIDQNSRGNGR